MALDVERNDLTIGIIGAGTMGRGIAQIAAVGGIEVLLTDTTEGVAAEAAAFVGKMLDRAAEKGKMTAADADAAKGRITVVTGDLAPFARCHVAIEAIVEDLEVKRGFFAAIEDAVNDDCILATNTSSLSVTAIAAACKRPERVAGFHFFVPVPLMKLVEVIKGVLTEDWVTTALVALGRRMGHDPVTATDTPGFLVNHAGRGLVTEGLRVLGEGVADAADVDRVMRETAGFRMGPFDLLDLMGLDVSLPVMESIYERYYQEPRFRPAPAARQRRDAGLLGRKSGRGFYSYAEGKQETPAEAPPPAAEPLPLWISRADAKGHEAVTAVLTATGVSLDGGERPAPGSVCVVTPLGDDATTAAVAQGLDARRTVAVDTLFPLDRRRTLMTTPVTEGAVRDAAHAALAADGKPVTVIRDSAGFIAQRMIATIVNIGCDIAQQRIASPADIDKAVTMALGYPRGPLTFGDDLEPARVLAVLEGMQRFYGDPRYRPSPWLKRRALIGVSLTLAED
jgi:3-hydroxybutyryl-CoA dehydrogenase